MNIFDRARQLAAQKQITQSEALSELSKRRAFRRHANYGTLQLTPADQRAIDARLEKRAAYWWQRD